MFLAFWPLIDRTVVDRKQGRERGKTCSEWPQVGIEVWDTAVRTEPWYMGRTRYRVSFQGAPIRAHLKSKYMHTTFNTVLLSCILDVNNNDNCQWIISFKFLLCNGIDLAHISNTTTRM